MESKIKEYALKHYAKRFRKSNFHLDARGKKTVIYYTVDPIVQEFDTHWTVRDHRDASPIILSKNVLL